MATSGRLLPESLKLLSDGYEGYEPAILDVFGRRYPAGNSGLKGGPSNPVIRWPQGLPYGQVIRSNVRLLFHR
jgi:hypothetical protein